MWDNHSVEKRERIALDTWMRSCVGVGCLDAHRERGILSRQTVGTVPWSPPPCFFGCCGILCPCGLSLSAHGSFQHAPSCALLLLWPLLFPGMPVDLGKKLNKTVRAGLHQLRTTILLARSTAFHK